ncbi:hypothetical protein [Mycolicibacterium sp. PDY-3]|uniref:hypothetical protein n=1 Tax=Mycolicibacterium sp. PDY-3 TaxID=3376069 RepID=UPI00379049C6
MPSKRLMAGYRLYHLSIKLGKIPLCARLAQRIRKMDVCRDYVSWSWNCIYE